MNEVQQEVAVPTRLEDCVEEYRPPRMECLRAYNINIRFLSVGCLIEVGCQSIAFSTIKEGMEALNQYVAKPYEVRQIWEKRFQEEEK